MMLSGQMWGSSVGRNNPNPESIKHAPKLKTPFLKRPRFIVWIVCFFLAPPVTMVGMLGQQDQWFFWMLVPPLVAGILGVICGALLELWMKDHQIDYFEFLVYLCIIPIFFVSGYLLYYIPVLGVWIITHISFSTNKGILWNYVGIWWIILVVTSGLLVFSPKSAVKIIDWLFPKAGSDQSSLFVSYLGFVMPWLVVIAHWIQSLENKRRLRIITLVTCLMVCFLYLGVGIVLELDIENIVMVLIGLLCFLVINGMIAKGLLHLGRLPHLKSVLLGTLLLVVNAAIGGTFEGLELEMLLAPILFIVVSLGLLPLFAGLSLVIASGLDKAGRLFWFVALLELPIIYCPFYIDAREQHMIYTAKEQADQLIQNDKIEEAVILLSNLYDKASLRKMVCEANEIAIKLVSVFVDNGFNERGLLFANLAIKPLGEISFGDSDQRCEDDDCFNADNIQKLRGHLLDLMILKSRALINLDKRDDAIMVGLDAWKKAVLGQMWSHLRRIAETIAPVYQKAGMNVDAYWWLIDARNRIMRGGGSTEDVQMLNQHIKDFETAIGEKEFIEIVNECNRIDPEWCTPP